MANSQLYAVGIDLGGTKIEAAIVDEEGHLHQRSLLQTNVKCGYAAILSQIIDTVCDLKEKAVYPPFGVGIGVAGQIDKLNGDVSFAPNLKWKDVPLQSDLSSALGMPVVITNDVRAATWGEWIHGAGRNCDDLVCLFIGTGIGGGIVSNGQIISGCSNTAGELGHITIDLHGPSCHCGNKGCLEALAGGWAISKLALEAVSGNPAEGAYMLKMAGGNPDDITAKVVVQAYTSGDPLASRLMNEAEKALTAGIISIINALNPCRVILGGGVIEGMPGIIDRISKNIFQGALKAAAKHLQILPAQLHNDAGVIGAASLAMHLYKQKNRES